MKIAHVALVVRDYDEAIAWFTQKLGFRLRDLCGNKWDLIEYRAEVVLAVEEASRSRPTRL